MKRFLLYCLFSLFITFAYSQEFRVSVSVNSTQLQSSDRGLSTNTRTPKRIY